jgi:ABC-2 type transport system permease protein
MSAPDPKVGAKVGAKVAGKAPRGAIRDQGYQPYTGSYTPEGGRWRLIFGRMLKMTARQPWVLVMLILSIFPGLVGGVITWVQAKMYAAGVGASPDPNVFYLFTKWYGTLIIGFLTALFAGGGAIADDARVGAFPFYFARPVTREQYLVGKLMPPIVLVFCVTVGPAMLLAIARVALAKDTADAFVALLSPLRTIALGLIEALALGVPVVALSSTSRGRGYVQGAFAALFLLPWILGAVFVNVTRSPWPDILSIRAHLLNVGRFVFAIPLDEAERALPVWVSAAVLTALVVGSLALLRKRLESMEVVGS